MIDDVVEEDMVEGTEGLEAFADEAEEVVEVVSVIDALVEELRGSPESALKLATTMSKITKPWEAITAGGAPVASVEGHLTPQQTVVGSGLVTGFRLSTIFGDEVARVLKASPKWKVYIEGEYISDAPMITHATKAVKEVQAFVEERLQEKGYVTP